MGKKVIKKIWKFMKVRGVLNRAYKVSDHGDIVHSKTMTPLKQNRMYKRSSINGSDYQSVYIPEIGTAIRVHRIVCETFRGTAPQGKRIVHHIDGMKDNNHLSNLRWVSSAENMMEFFQENKPRSYSNTVISKVKRLINSGKTNDYIATEVGMSDSNVSSIKYGHIRIDIKPYSKFQ